MRSASDPVILGPAGLQLSGNTFSASPDGAMSKADNVIISQKGVAQPRNGQERASTMPVAADLPFSLVEFQQQIIANYGTSKTDTVMGLGRVNAGVITPYAGTYNPVGDNGAATDYGRMKFVLAELFLHFCTALGPKVLEAYNGTPRNSGLSRVPDLSLGVTQPTGTQAGVLPYNSSVAYRYTHKRITSTGQVLTSPVSNRFVMTNRFLIPVGGLVRTGGNLVTATMTPGTIWKSVFLLPFVPTTTFTLSPGEANFAAATDTVNSRFQNTFTWLEAGANVASTVAQELNPGPLVPTATIQLPADAIAGDIIQLFKSVATSDSSIEPSADLYLCNEYLLTAGDIVVGAIGITDFTPESVLKTPLYTNPSDGDGLGEQGQNFPPPLYLDVACFDSNTFYLSTTGQQYLDLEMLGVGGPNGVQDGDTFTIFDGVATTLVFTFKNAPTLPGHIPIVSDGLPGYNIAWTTYVMVTQIANVLKTNGVTGLTITGATSPNGFPGGLRIERVDYLQVPFQVKASRPTSWTPALQAAVYTNSFANAVPHGLTWSKDGQSEAVPVTNQDVVGVANYYGRRCFGLKNALIILKEGDGIWSFTGSGKYNLQQISKANIIAPDCACVFFDSVWAYTDQGILRISDTGGVTVVSRPIETEINRLATLLPTETYAWSFAVPYETERRVMFFVPVAAASSATGGAPQLQAYCYCEATNAWTGPLAFNEQPVSGLVSTGHKLWLGAYDSVFAQGRITSERKTGGYLDIAEAEWSNVLTITADPKVVQLATAGSLRKGSGVSQTIGGTLYRTKISAVNTDGSYTLAETVPWVNGACTVYDPYPVEAQFLPEGTPGHRKALTRLFTLYKPKAFSNLFGRTTLETDQVQAELEIDTPAPGFGSTPFGSGAFGNPSPMVIDSNPIRAQWVNAAQFFPGYKLDEVWCQMKLQGMGMKIDTAEAPAGRGK